MKHPYGDGAPVAPHQSCIACYRGDTTTALVVSGVPEWHVAFLIMLGVPVEEAEVTIERERKNDGWYDDRYRVCRACAEASPFASVLVRASATEVSPYTGPAVCQMTMR